MTAEQDELLGKALRDLSHSLGLLTLLSDRMLVHEQSMSKHSALLEAAIERLGVVQAMAASAIDAATKAGIAVQQVASDAAAAHQLAARSYDLGVRIARHLGVELIDDPSVEKDYPSVPAGRR